jgi:putative hydrolase of the HAD superfamily
MTRKIADKSSKSKNQAIQAAIFDIDDTLYPERAFVRSGYNAVGKHLRLRQGRSEPLADWLWRRFLAGQTDRAFDELNDKFQLGLTQAGIAELVEVYRFHRPDISPFAGIVDVLEQLQPHLLLGIVSDGPARMQRNKLDALGLADFFQAVVLTDNLGPGLGKPNPAGFELVSQKLAIPHAGCAYVSDNPAKDFVGPNSLGWLTVQYIRPGQIYAEVQPPPAGEPEYTLDCDEQLLNLLLG